MANRQQEGFTAAMGRERNDFCKTKGLLYGGDNRPVTPVKRGTKGPVDCGVQKAAPYGTYLVSAEEVYDHDYHAARKATGGMSAAKVGANGFDASTYAANLIANAQIQQNSTLKNFVGSAGVAGGKPFATSDIVNQDVFARDYHRLPAKGQREIPGKVGAGHGLGTQDIDTAVYAANLAANHQMQQDSCLKNFVGSGGPMAGYSSEPDLVREYHAKKALKDGASKVGVQHHDASVYAANLANNHNVMAEAQRRNFTGSGNILASGQA